MNAPLRLVAPRSQRQTPSADPAAVHELIDEWPDEYLACRAGNHHWTPSRVEDARSFWLITEICPRCTSEREYDIHPVTGQQFGAKRIHYPDDFLAKGVGRIGQEGRDSIRLASVMRNMPKPRKLSPDAHAVTHPHKATREALGLEAG